MRLFERPFGNRSPDVIYATTTQMRVNVEVRDICGWCCRLRVLVVLRFHSTMKMSAWCLAKQELCQLTRRSFGKIFVGAAPSICRQ